MVNKLLDAANFLKTKLKTDEFQQKLNQAVNEQNWQASTQLLHQIANASYNYEKEQKIIAFIYEKIKNKSWKKVLKTLHLIDFLLKYGPTTLIDNLRENIYEFRCLDSYTHMDNGIDRGQSVRKQSKVLVDLLADEQVLSEERAKAKKIKERMANVIGSGAYYGSFSGGEGSSNAPKKQGYQNYNSQSFNYAGKQNAGLSFGESVVQSLKANKKISQTQNNSDKIETGKLNINKMIEKKNQSKTEEKKNFNNLAMKLVKPPQKKTIPQGKKQSPVISPVKHHHKPTPKVDIMDLDTLSFGNTNTNANTNANTNTNTNTNANTNTTSNVPASTSSQLDMFDFLGTGTTVAQSVAQTSFASGNSVAATNNNQQNSINFNLYSNQNNIQSQPQQHQNQHPQQQPTAASYFIQPAAYYPNTINSKPNSTVTSQIQNFPQIPNISQIKNISLNLNQPKQQPITSSNLIDFSNFRQQLSSISSNPKPSDNSNIVSNWNW